MLLPVGWSATWGADATLLSYYRFQMGIRIYVPHRTLPGRWHPISLLMGYPPKDHPDRPAAEQIVRR
jgi:hypothetical protein